MALSVTPVGNESYSPVFQSRSSSKTSFASKGSQVDLFVAGSDPATKVTVPTGYACQLNLFGGNCDWIRLSNGSDVPVVKPGNQLRFDSRAIEMGYAASFAVRTKEGIGSATAFYVEEIAPGRYRNYILTNRHVVLNQDGTVDKNPMLTSLWTGVVHQAEVLNISKNMDGAVVTVESDQPFFTVPIARTYTVENGDFRPITPIGMRAFAIGTTLGAFPGTVSGGNISHPYRVLDPKEGWYVQFTAPISPGNSGGGLFREDGSLVGIVTATIPSSNNRPAQNVNFAVPADFALNDMGFGWLLDQTIPVS